MKRCHCSLGRLLLFASLGAAVLLAHHLVDGYAWCQEYWNWDGKRNSKDGRRWPAEDGVVITYINGIFHSVPEWESITHQLQAIFGHEVRPFYNPSSGWWITDASKAGYHLLRKPANDTVAQALGEHLGQAVDDVGKGRVLHIAHSGGALITYLAAQHHLTERQRDKIDVLTFGGARSITRKYFSGRVVNYYARNDPLVKLDRRAAELMKLTSDTKFQEVSEKHNTTFVFLEGRARQFVLDHSLEGPTYQHALRKEAKAFRRAHFGPLSPLSWDYEFSLLRLVRKKAASLSGVHDFFSTERFGARSLRKVVARLTGFHGFFSGKKPSAGVHIAVIGEGPEGSHRSRHDDEGGFFASVRRWWSWGGPADDGVTLAPPTREPPGGWRSYGDPGSRYWLGFRWFSDAKRAAESEDEGSVDEGAQAVSRSRWEQVQHLWAFGREASPEEAGESGTEPPGGVVPEAADGESGSPREAGAAEGQSPLSAVPDRRWLSVGWTPWGAVQMPDGESVKVGASSGLEGVGEGGPSRGEGEGPPESGGEGEGMGKGEVVGPVLEAQTRLEESSYLKRWWPGTPAEEVVEPNPPGEEGGRGGGEDVELEPVPEAQPLPEEASYLKRWWPASPAQEVASAAASAAGSVSEAGPDGEGKGEGGGEGAELGAVVEAQPVSKESSYAKWWWTGSPAQEVASAAAPTAGSVSEAGPDGEGKGGGEGVELGQVLEAQPLPEESSYVKRWWPGSPAQEVAPAAAGSVSMASSDGEGEGEGGGEGAELVPVIEAQPLSEELSYVKRWWPGRSAQEAAPAVAPAGSSVGHAVSEEATAVGGKEGEGKGVGQLVEGQPLSEEKSYLQKWWPAKPAQEVERVAAPAASSVDPVSVDPVVLGQKGKEASTAIAEGEEEGAEGLVGPVLEGQAVSEEPSYLKRWWPASSARGVEPAAAPVSNSGVPVVPDPEGEEEVTAVAETDVFHGTGMAAAAEGGAEEDGGESSSRKQELSLLRLWWPSAKEPAPQVEPQQHEAGTARGGDAAEKNEEEEEEEEEEEKKEGGEEDADFLKEPSTKPSEPPLVSRRWPSFKSACPLEAIRSDDVPPAVYEEWSSSEEDGALLQGDAFSSGGGQESLVGEVIVAEGIVQPEDGQAPSPVGSGKQDELPPKPRESEPEDKPGREGSGEVLETEPDVQVEPAEAATNGVSGNGKLGREGSAEVLETEPELQVEAPNAAADGVSDKESAGGGGSDSGSSSKAADRKGAP